MFEVHAKPEQALCDDHRGLEPERFDALVGELATVGRAAGRELGKVP